MAGDWPYLKQTWWRYFSSERPSDRLQLNRFAENAFSPELPGRLGSIPGKQKEKWPLRVSLDNDT
jgi:hypothetical protein